MSEMLPVLRMSREQKKQDVEKQFSNDLKQKQTFSSHSLMTVNIKTNDFEWGKNKVFLIYSRHFAENKYCYCKVLVLWR